jgi:hypothetical protein
LAFVPDRQEQKKHPVIRPGCFDLSQILPGSEKETLSYRSKDAL